MLSRQTPILARFKTLYITMKGWSSVKRTPSGVGSYSPGLRRTHIRNGEQSRPQVPLSPQDAEFFTQPTPEKLYRTNR